MTHQASPRGTYLVVAEKLREFVVAAAAGSPLPSEADLMREHRVSRNTVRRALKVLEGSGYVQSLPGVGWRVMGGESTPSLEGRMIDLITEDDLAVGDLFPSEAKLCQRFGMSRSAVRRALAQMEGAGLLSTTHGKGRVVRALPTLPGQP